MATRRRPPGNPGAVEADTYVQRYHYDHYFLCGLRNYPYRIALNGWFFGGAALLALGIAAITVSAQAVKAAIANPVDSLKGE